ncbi:MAG: hypothetical protein KF846_08490 [Cyclobacteriaceae bacterium]|nr:hypothetical protein [Cyclobacteriaceae bacterium]
MKSKFLLPLMAVVFAVASAFVAKPVEQMAWFDSNGSQPGGGEQAPITIPADRPCLTTASSHICKIVVSGIEFNAYDTQQNAENGGGSGSAGLLRYD